MKKYLFRRYRPEYKKFFAIEKNRLRKALNYSAKIEHIGSTAIGGLGGKGIIDLVIGVSKSKIAKSKKDLEEAGYEFREKASYPERLFFRRDYPSKNGKRRVHIHLVKLGGEDWKEMVGFRDYLLKHPKVIGRYVRIKKEAVKKARGEGDVYRKHKEKFIKSITTKALTRKMKISKQNKNKFERMVEEATIDCYNEYEQCSGWACTLEEELPLPLKCLIFGEEATLVDVGADEHGTAVLGVITKNKKKIRIPIQDVEAIDKIAKNLEWLKAYRYWIKNG